VGHCQTKSYAFRRASIGLVLLDELTFFTLRSILHVQDTGEPEVVREIIATRIIAAAKFGERDPARLLAAALRRPD
jgi:hypothetical protein